MLEVAFVSRAKFHAVAETKALHSFYNMAENVNVEDWQGVIRTSRTGYVPSEYTASEIDPKGRTANVA